MLGVQNAQNELSSTGDSGSRCTNALHRARLYGDAAAEHKILFLLTLLHASRVCRSGSQPLAWRCKDHNSTSRGTCHSHICNGMREGVPLVFAASPERFEASFSALRKFRVKMIGLTEQQAGSEEARGQLGSLQPNSGVPPPTAAAASRPPATVDWRAGTSGAPISGQPKPAASWDAAVAAFDAGAPLRGSHPIRTNGSGSGAAPTSEQQTLAASWNAAVGVVNRGVPLHGSHLSRANGTGPPPLNWSQNGVVGASNGGWPSCSDRQLSNGWPPASIEPSAGPAAVVNGGAPCSFVKDATAPQAAAQGLPGRRKRTRWDVMASDDACHQNGMSGSNTSGRGSHANASHSSALFCVPEQREAKIPRNGQALGGLMSCRDASTTHDALKPQDGSQGCKYSQGMSECELLSKRASHSYRQWLANMALEDVDRSLFNIPWKVFQLVGNAVKRACQKQTTLDTVECNKAHARRSLSKTANEAASTDAAAAAPGAAAVQGDWPPVNEKRVTAATQGGSGESAAVSGQLTEATAIGGLNAAAADSQAASQVPAGDGSHAGAAQEMHGAAADPPGTAALASSPAATQAAPKTAPFAAGAPSHGGCQPPESGAASTAVAPSKGAPQAPANGLAAGSCLPAIRTVVQPEASPGSVPNGCVQSGAAAAVQGLPETAGALRRSGSGKHEPIRFVSPASSPRKNVWERVSPRAKVQPAPVWDRLGPQLQARLFNMHVLYMFAPLHMQCACCIEGCNAFRWS